jgi:PKD domain
VDSRDWGLVSIVLLISCGSGESIDQLAYDNGFPDGSGDVAVDTRIDSSLVQGAGSSGTPTKGAITANDDSTDVARPSVGDAPDAPAEDASVIDAVASDACSSDVCGAIGIVINVCPQIQGYLVSPVDVVVGEAVHMTASATDDNGDILSFQWTANQGVFTAAGSPNTDFRCSTAGTATVTLIVSDGKCEDGIDQNILCR